MIAGCRSCDGGVQIVPMNDCWTDVQFAGRGGAGGGVCALATTLGTNAATSAVKVRTRKVMIEPQS
jgi:hypothetical protein